MLKTKLLGATAAAQALAIEDVFSTYLYTGNGSTQTITNGIDLAGEGGLVWIKYRSTSADHFLFDTVNGATKYVRSNSTGAQVTNANSLTAFNSDGFSLGSSVGNLSATTIASWTFRKAERFFDVVTYTGTGANRTVAHNLGVVPGCIIVKRTDTTGDWQVYHRSNTAAPETDYLVLNSTAVSVDDNTRWNDTLPTSTVFSLGTNATVNASGGTYVAYLFAHDPLGPSGDGSDGLIACGSFTADVSGNATVNLGWEPQFVLYKNTDGLARNWHMVDSMRGMPVGTAVSSNLFPNLSSAESASGYDIDPTATGFTARSLDAQYPYIYIAIRRGPMREPTSGTEVYFPSTASGVISTNFPVDFHMRALRASASVTNHNVRDRLRGGTIQLVTSATAAETVSSDLLFDSNNGLRFSFPSGEIQHFFRRAPKCFDMVAYTGTGVARTINHNLGVAPEFIIVKRRNVTGGWGVYNAVSGPTKAIFLNTSAAEVVQTLWNNTSPTESVFSLGTSITVNAASDTYIAYLFSTLSGVSKVGSYTGNGTSQTVNCGFTTGARFILIKRLSATGDWHLFDSARGIVSGNDPYHRPNTDFAEVTTNDSVDPDNSGFIVNQNANTDINVSSATYVYLAIA